MTSLSDIETAAEARLSSFRLYSEKPVQCIDDVT